MRKIASLYSDEGGASIIEMALILPVFTTMLLGMVDISRAYSAELQLEQSGYRAIEKVQQYQATEDTYTTLKNEAVSAANAAGFTDVTTSNVTVDYWLECDGVRQGNGTPGNGYDTTCSTGQRYGRWVNVSLTHKFKPLFASNIWPGSNSDGTYTLHASAGLRTQ
jgi:Flp pilus assembly protein TadG